MVLNPSSADSSQVDAGKNSIFAIAAVKGEGLNRLVKAMADAGERLKAPPEAEERE